MAAQPSNVVKFPPRSASRSFSFSRAPAEDAVERARAEIFRRWSRFLPEAEARAQADEFARSAAALFRDNFLTEAELDAVVAIVATEMAADA
jgi:hypothetical protein